MNLTRQHVRYFALDVSHCISMHSLEHKQTTFTAWFTVCTAARSFSSTKLLLINSQASTEAMAPSTSTATLLLLLFFLVAAATSPSRQTAHAARVVLQEAEAPAPGVPGREDGTPGAAPAEAEAETPLSELLKEWELGFVGEEAPAPAASSSSAQPPVGSASSSVAVGILWRKIWWFDEPYYRPSPGSKNQWYPFTR
jgi:hypothetical protein